MKTGVSVIHPCHGKGVVVDTQLGSNVIRFNTGYRGMFTDSELTLAPVQQRKEGLDTVKTDRVVLTLLVHLLK